MTSPSILVLGAGSIGTRHARNLVAAGAQVTVTDPDSDRAAAVAGARAVPFDLASLGTFDGAVVASPTVHHAEHLRWALRAARQVLVEKPIAVAPEEVADIVASEGKRVMVGYNLRFHQPLLRVADIAHSGQLGAVAGMTAWFGSWLPAWRTGVDYRSTYSAQRALGGGVLLDAIHELDLLMWLAGDGDFDVAGAVLSTSGTLETDVEDSAHALLRHSDGWTAHVSLDYLSRRYRRGIEVVGTKGTVRYDWARGEVEFETAEDHIVTPCSPPIADSYVAQTVAFVEWLDGATPEVVDGGAGLRSLELAALIREAGTS